MKKALGVLVFCFVISSYGFSQASNDVTFTIDVTNVVVNNGKVYIAIFNNARDFRDERPFVAFELNSTAATISQEVTIPAGDYLLSAFQDANGNGKLDYKLFGIPRELVGISNYDGRGFPSRDFDRQKIRIDSSVTRYTLGLYSF